MGESQNKCVEAYEKASYIVFIAVQIAGLIISIILSMAFLGTQFLYGVIVGTIIVYVAAGLGAYISYLGEKCKYEW